MIPTPPEDFAMAFEVQLGPIPEPAPQNPRVTTVRRGVDLYTASGSALPVESKPASVQCGSDAAPRTGFRRGIGLRRSVMLANALPENVALERR